MLPRNRARLFNPNEKSSSRFSSSRCFCTSVSTLYASALVSAAVRGGMSKGRSFPCTRTRGALLVERCRSLPAISIIFFKSSLNVMPAIFLLRLQNGLAKNFFHRRQPRRDFLQAAPPQRDHSLFHSLLLQFQRGRPYQNQFAQFVVDFHDFI